MKSWEIITKKMSWKMILWKIKTWENCNMRMKNDLKMISETIITKNQYKNKKMIV
jgi:hypothetical protein